MESDIMIYLGALALGALHAFEPGHGKSIIAAYMIGTRGKAIDGIILGFIVTFTHTFSVIILGIIAKILAHSYTSEQLHAWLGLFSSLLILAVGLWMLRERLTNRDGRTHFHFFCKDHGHDHSAQSHNQAHPDHSHNSDDHSGHSHVHPHEHPHDHSHDHPHDHNDHQASAHSSPDHAGHRHHNPAAITGADGRVNRWRLLLLGISGGLIPCPPAIAALLAAIGAGRIGQGLTVAIFFSLGLGLVMMTIGVVLSQAGRLSQKVSDNLALAHKLGIASAAIITILGCVTLFHSLRSLLS